MTHEQRLKILSQAREHGERIETAARELAWALARGESATVARGYLCQIEAATHDARKLLAAL